MSAIVTGSERIAEAFESARAEGRRAALMPYLMAGYPDLNRSRAIAHAYVAGGADLIELGIPFSDPLADGPVIHAADVAALATGVRLDAAIGIAREVADEVPVVVMCYVNVILARGLERFADLLVSAGASGLIVPDLPLEEAPATLEALDRRGLALVPLVAPTTPEERLAQIGERARGFLYTVSVTGTTGERESNAGLPEIVARARAHTDVPVAVGFGIGSPEQARAAADAGADGVIIGTRLVRAAGEAVDPASELLSLVRAFAQALG
ncbi:MAG TPA: tryptophan synthase subunit alpha [Solirubrobacteraceae bacterium]|nr:tryptophan synthase subunit alpha [Solirubrobacteraceae bacterium]